MYQIVSGCAVQQSYRILCYSGKLADAFTYIVYKVQSNESNEWRIDEWMDERRKEFMVKWNDEGMDWGGNCMSEWVNKGAMLSIRSPAT